MHYLQLFLALWALFSTPVWAQESPIWVQGALEDAIATDDTFNTGGTIVVNGFTMNVPKNLLVQFPAAWVPWKEFVANKADFAGYETLVIGNSINGEPRVAQVQLYEFFEGLSSGWVESVDFADGSLKIQNGPTSPSITSFSGFPMCIPRNETDPLCPLTNRPFVGPGTFTAPDPLVMAPFQAGDFITFSGFRRGSEVIAFSIVAQNVQINTLGDIVYVRMELGLLGIDNPSPNAEIAESRFIGFVSNNRATVSLYAMDVDPCTGTTSDRIIASMGLRGGRNAQNKFEYRNEILFRYTREYRVIAEIDGVAKTRVTKNNLTAGTYVQPVNVWVPGEQDVPGVPPVSYDFSQMEFLTKGVGADDAGSVWGPLEPFPQTGVFIETPVCAATPAARDLKVEKRGSIGRWYGRARADAISQLENVDTTDPVVVVAPEEAAAIAEKKQEEAANNDSQ
ncbi:hypothetical protein K456DRAFT_1754758 [Colletotrichum gloeosporioides 23]|nr:hypothetical protein K456DRAFT_1754758 [Colletotrichum gloeosporioides 23]